MARKVWTFNVAVDFWRHPKAVLAGRDGRELFLCALGWSGEYRQDGRIPREALDQLAGLVGLKAPATRKAVSRLTAVGMWEPTPEGWLIHDYLEWQMSAAEREVKAAANAARQQAYKERRGAAPKPPTNPPTNPPGNALPDDADDASKDDQRGVRGEGVGFAGLESPLNSTPATNGDSGHQLSPNGEIKDQVDQDFQTFWDQFPKRIGRLRDRDGTHRRWRRLTDANRAKALVAVVNYAAERGDDKPTAAADPDRWLKDRSWLDYLEPVTTVTRLDQRRRTDDPLSRLNAIVDREPPA